MTKILMPQPRKTLKTFTFYEEMTAIPIGNRSQATSSKVIFRDAYNGYVIKRVSSYAYCCQGANTWKFEGVNPIIFHVVDTNIKEQTEGWTGYLNFWVKKSVPDSIVTIINTVGTLINNADDIKFPYCQDIELNVPVLDNELVINFIARWSLRQNSLDPVNVSFYAWINVTIEY